MHVSLHPQAGRPMKYIIVANLADVISKTCIHKKPRCCGCHTISNCGRQHDMQACICRPAGQWNETNMQACILSIWPHLSPSPLLSSPTTCAPHKALLRDAIAFLQTQFLPAQKTRAHPHGLHRRTGMCHRGKHCSCDTHQNFDRSPSQFLCGVVVHVQFTRLAFI